MIHRVAISVLILGLPTLYSGIGGSHLKHSEAGDELIATMHIDHVRINFYRFRFPKRSGHAY